MMPAARRWCKGGYGGYSVTLPTHWDVVTEVVTEIREQNPSRNYRNHYKSSFLYKSIEYIYSKRWGALFLSYAVTDLPPYFPSQQKSNPHGG